MYRKILRTISKLSLEFKLVINISSIFCAASFTHSMHVSDLVLLDSALLITAQGTACEVGIILVQITLRFGGLFRRCLCKKLAA
jgi:hypothetical protein